MNARMLGAAFAVIAGMAEAVTMLKPGAYAFAVSVGSPQGTPGIALPLDGQLGDTRRYALGKITVQPAVAAGTGARSCERPADGKGF